MMKLATQAVKQKFAQSVAFMQQTRMSLSFLDLLQKSPIPHPLARGECTHKSNYPPQSPLSKGGSRKSSSLLGLLWALPEADGLGKGGSRKSNSLTPHASSRQSRPTQWLPFIRGGLGWGKNQPLKLLQTCVYTVALARGEETKRSFGGVGFLFLIARGLLYGRSIIPYRLGLVFLLVVGLCSCGSLTSSGLNGTNLTIGTNVTPIREIKPKQDNQATVYIQGKVEKKAPLMKQWAYQISDSTGQIWVVTNQKNLNEGAQVVIKGKIRYRSIPLAGKELGEVYLEEQ